MRIKYLHTKEAASGDCTKYQYDADIIILSFNRLDDTLAAIDSALCQKEVDARIALLDQGSTTETFKALIEKIRTCPTVTLFAAAENLGVGGGRNFLSSIGNGKIIVGLDNDAVFADEYVVRNALNMFDAEARLGALGFNILTGDGTRTEDFSWGYPMPLKNRCHERFLTTTFVGAGHAIRRQTWDEVGDYDTKLFFTWEEYDFCLRAIARKWDVIYDGTLRVNHKVASEERVRWSEGRRRLFVRNRLIIARKWRGTWLSLLPRMMGYMINGAINGQFRATLSGIIAAIAEDKNISKQCMTPEMRNYLWVNEQRHRGPLYARLNREILKPISGNC